MSLSSPIIVLDRDGVINHDSDDYIKSPEEWQPIEGSLEAITQLKAAGYRVAIATNQSGIGRGYYDEATLQAMHDKMHQLLKQLGSSVDFIAFCPHLPTDLCNCRKPKTGLLEQIQVALDAPLAGSFFVGDSLKDLQAAQAFNMQPVLVLTGKGRKTFDLLESTPDAPDAQNTHIYPSLAEFVHTLLG